MKELELYTSPLIDKLFSEITSEDQLKMEDKMMDEILNYHL